MGQREKGKVATVILTILIALMYIGILAGGLLAYYGKYQDTFVLITGESDNFLAEEFPIVARAFGLVLLTLAPTALMAIAASHTPFRFAPWIRLLIIAGALALSIWVSTLYIDCVDQIHYQGKYNWMFQAVFYGAPYIALVLMTLACVLPVLLGCFEWQPALIRLLITMLFSYPIYVVSVFAYLVFIIGIIFLIYWVYDTFHAEGGSGGHIYIFYYED